MDPKFVTALSDLLINLSAGWIGAAIIVPLNVKTPKFKVLPFLANVLLSIVSFTIAYKLR
ncbi:MAG: hypothetical protein CEO21_256 [Microgenomates group bacterium Gr01-1014_80]|nr:MAG: hypothetical protein CEO21_256 [Microgenomates group bacterium Gr01-1014_80]